MKKLVSISILASALLFGVFSTEAKTTKKSSKAKTTQTSRSIAKNVYGYADPSGHTYQGTNQGIKITITIHKRANGVSSATISTSDGSSAMYGWYQSENNLSLGSLNFQISDDGKMLIGENGIQYKLIK